MESPDPSFFGLVLSTHRPKDLGPDATSYFLYEPAIAAIAILFFRTTVYLPSEPVPLRVFFSLLLAFLAYSKRSYELISAVELFSYAIPFLLFRKHSKRTATHSLLAIAASALLSLLLAHFAATGHLMRLVSIVTPNIAVTLLEYLIPIAEMQAAYDVMGAFAHPVVLQKQLYHLLFVTFHIQVGMGYLGIAFLRNEQDRRNQLVRMDMQGQGSDKEIGERSRSFQRSAAPFIFFIAFPYMLQIIAYGNINKFAFTCVQHDLHRTVRLHQLFDDDNHLIAMATESPTSPEAYANHMNNVLNTAYDIFNRKLFSLPKILLLPTVFSQQPVLVAQVFPFILFSDWIKAALVSYVTTTIEGLQKEIQNMRAIRSKVESFDIKNAELLQRSGQGATQFTQRRWEEMTVKVQTRAVVMDLMSRSKEFFQWIHRNFVFSVLIDCALAQLIAVGKIVSADTFVYSRAIEDAVDMMLMRSRGEAELARMMTEIDRLQELVDIWDKGKKRTVLPCNLSPKGEHILVLRNLVYSRGTAHVRADHIELFPGVYALTGSNGSGKSTLFRLLMSCTTNDKTMNLPESINLLSPAEPFIEQDDLLREVACEAADADSADEEEEYELEVSADGQVSQVERRLVNATSHVPKLSITMPSSHVEEISQTFYWPLYSRPIDWIYQDHVLESCTVDQLDAKARKIAEELHELEFFQALVVKENQTVVEALDESLASTAVDKIISELLEEKEDWFGDLSGGQKSKVELVRKVFVHEKCPDVLLIDETMAPLDPASKSLVMAKLKGFCSDSIIIVIYHTDVGQGKDVNGNSVECVPSNNFFDKNIHLERGVVQVRDTC